MVKNGWDITKKIDKCIIPCWFSPQNYIALDGLEVILGQTWLQHSLKRALAWIFKWALNRHVP